MAVSKKRKSKSLVKFKKTTVFKKMLKNHNKYIKNIYKNLVLYY